MNNTAKVFPAHIRTNAVTGQCEVQPCEEHSRNVAKYTSDNLSAVGLASTGYLIGLLHDGKYTNAFRDYIISSYSGNNVRKGSVIHTFAGVRYLLMHYHKDKCPDYESLASELMAWAIGSHHGQFDIIDSEGKSGFSHRIDEDADTSSKSMNNLLRLCTSEKEINDLFRRSTDEVERISDMITKATDTDDERLFMFGLFARLLLSALINGDRRDTAEFMDGIRYPEWPSDMRTIWKERLAYLEKKVSGLRSDKPINAARREISDRCRSFASHCSGIYQLNVPTGAGKTLSGMRFALAHAEQHNKKRIFVVAPLLSIIDQNSRVIRDYFGDDSMILEHHIDVAKPDAAVSEENAELRSRYERMAETYNVPVVITTLVQLLNTLFSGKATSVRRMHSLCDSIILIDEVQTVPTKMLSLFNSAITFLSEICGATVVLCSATQPSLASAERPLKHQPEDIVPHDDALWSPFKRTNIVDKGIMSLYGIFDFAESVLDETDSLLIVCNRKDQAEELYSMFDVKNRFHLSASMCMQHRRDVMERIAAAQSKLANIRSSGRVPDKDDKIICISTQVIEAGVDISFGRVIRLTAGLSNCVQAFGRENRNGESEEPVPAYIVTCKDEDLKKLPDISLAKTATAALLEEYKRHPEQFDNDLSSDKAVDYYYKTLYREMKSSSQRHQDYSVEYERDKLTLYSLLSANRTYADRCKSTGTFYMNQAFATAGQLFEVFDEDTTTVIVPYGDGERIYSGFFSEKAKNDPAYIRALLDEAKGYTVSVYKYQLESLYKNDAVTSFGNGMITLLKPGYYDEDTGLSNKIIKEGGNTWEPLIK